MPEACKFPSFDSRQRMFLWTNMGVDFASHPVVGLVLQVEDAEKFPLALGFESLDSLFRLIKQGPGFIKIEEDGGDNWHVLIG